MFVAGVSFDIGFDLWLVPAQLEGTIQQLIAASHPLHALFGCGFTRKLYWEPHLIRLSSYNISLPSMLIIRNPVKAAL